MERYLISLKSIVLHRWQDGIRNHGPLSFVRFAPLQKGVRHDTNECRATLLAHIQVMNAPLECVLRLLITLILLNQLMCRAQLINAFFDVLDSGRHRLKVIIQPLQMLVKSSVSPLKGFDEFGQNILSFLLFVLVHALIHLDHSGLGDKLTHFHPLRGLGKRVDSILDSAGLRVLLDNIIKFSPIRLREELDQEMISS